MGGCTLAAAHKFCYNDKLKKCGAVSPFMEDIVYENETNEKSGIPDGSLC
jgi:hypothetical protein